MERPADAPAVLAAMSRTSSRASPIPLLLGLVGLGGAGLLALVADGDPRASVGAGEVAEERAATELVSAPLGEPDLAARTALRATPAVAPSEALEPLDGARSSRDPARRASARSEREFLTAFLALARREPGALEARARTVLDGVGPAPEKVALLRALEQGGSRESIAWHEHAAHGSDESNADAVSVASYALGALASRAARDSDARAALARLAFERPEPAIALRRQAASALARSGDAAELEQLRVALLREQDELLVRGALASLAERPDVPVAQRILASFPELAPATPTVAERP